MIYDSNNKHSMFSSHYSIATIKSYYWLNDNNKYVIFYISSCVCVYILNEIIVHSVSGARWNSILLLDIIFTNCGLHVAKINAVIL